jgi:hypothetical protein
MARVREFALLSPRTRAGVARCAALLSIGCWSAAPPKKPGAASAPVSAPAPGAAGCVESDELRAYVSALDRERRSARDAALVASGARQVARRGVFLDPERRAKLDETLEDQGRRYAVVAHQAAPFEPELALARLGNELRRIDERPRGHGVPVLACGVRSCPRAPGGERRPVRAIAVELAPGETLGAALVLAYDYWWAQVSYPKHARCDALQEGGR